MKVIIFAENSGSTALGEAEMDMTHAMYNHQKYPRVGSSTNLGHDRVKKNRTSQGRW